MRQRDLSAAGEELAAARVAYAAGDARACRAALARGLQRARPGSATEASLRVLDARLRQWDGADEQAARDAFALARATGADVALAEIVLGTALYLEAQPEALDHLTHARALALAEGDDEAIVESGLLLGSALYTFERPDEAIAVADETERAADAAGDARGLYGARWLAAHIRLYARGEVADVVPDLERLLRAPVGLSADEVRGDLVRALADLGRDAEATALLDEAAAGGTTPWGRSVLLVSRAEVELAAGRYAHARAVADEALDVAPPTVACYAEPVRAWALLELGRVPPPPRPPPPRPVPLSAGCRDEVAGVVALARDDNFEASARFTAAAEYWARLVVRLELRCRLGAGVAQLRSGDVDAARATLGALHERAAAGGFLPLVRRIDAALAHPTAAANAPRLTPRQRDVLVLVRSGRTTHEIAARLGIAPSTVETHVRHAIMKLGARTRTEAAARSAARVGAPTTELTPEERRIAELLAAGVTVADAARLLHVSRRTMTRRVANIRGRLGAATTAELVAAVGGRS